MRRWLSAFVVVLAAAPATVSRADNKTLRVCADPAGLPFSNEKREGFENQLANVIATEMGATVEYTWWAQRRGFFRNTLSAKKCDVVIGVPKGIDMARTTKPYYRSTFAFVTRRDRDLKDLRSIDDPRLETLTIGVPLAGDDGANPAPVHALARRGIVNLRGFPLYAEIGRTVPAAAEAVLNGDLDVAILWGPVAGSVASKLVVTPIAEDADDGLPFAFDIAMGVRREDKDLALQLDGILTKKKDALDAVLRRARVPLK
jgi:mxaJ protein